jgi:hypothetical protein
MRRLLLASAAIAAIAVSTASAQVSRGGFPVYPLSTPQTVTPGFAGFGNSQPVHIAPHPTRFANGSVFLYDLGYPAAAQPVSILIVQPPAPSTPVAEEQHPSEKPLLLELQGDHWTTVENSGRSSVRVPGDRLRAAVQKPAVTVLVFRDGRAESTSGYAVIGDALFAQADYWSTGAWTRKIPLSDLDLPATLRANQERGSVFKLPAGPNEVVLQP